MIYKKEVVANPWIRDLYSGVTQLASSVAKSPAILSTLNPVQRGADIASSLVNKDIKPSIPILGSVDIGSQLSNTKISAPAVETYDNALTRFLDETSARNSYIEERWHSKGENLVTLIKEKKFDEIPSYLAHNVVANAPQQVAIIASVMTGVGPAGLATMGLSTAASTYADELKKGQDPLRAFVNSAVNGTAEVAFENMGTAGIAKKMVEKLGGKIGTKTAGDILKNTYKEIAKESLKNMKSEALEEALTSITQNTANTLIGQEKFDLESVLGDAFESAVVGGLSSAAITSPMVGTKNVNDALRLNRYKKVVEQSGGQYVGIQETPKGMDNLVLFNNEEGSTLAIPEGKFNPKNVKIKLDPNYRNSFLAQTEYLQNTNERMNNNSRKASQYQTRLMELAGNDKKKAVEMDAVLYRAVDLIENPDVLNKRMADIAFEQFAAKNDNMPANELLQKRQEFEDQYSDQTVAESLTPEELELYRKAENLTADERTLLNDILSDLKGRGDSYLDEGVLSSVRAIYAPHNYVQKEDYDPSLKLNRHQDSQKFARARSFDTLAEAQAFGNVPLRSGLTTNYKHYIDRMDASVAIKKLKSKLINDKVLSDKAKPGYVPLNIDQTFTVKDPSTNETVQLYAPKAIAKEINNLLFDTPLRDSKNWAAKLAKTVRKINAVSKSVRLLTGLFHHMAFELAYYLGTPDVTKRVRDSLAQGKFKDAYKYFNEDVNFLTNYKNGLDLWDESNEALDLMIKHNLTLGRIQDWDEQILREKTAFGKWADKNKLTKATKDKVVEAREAFTDFLFGKLGAGLKAKHALGIFESEMRKNPKANVEEVAKLSAQIANENFGGLHLKSMGRNPTVQYIWQLLAFAPDWTESNWRLYTQMVTGDTKLSRDMHKRIVSGMVTKYIIASILMSMVTAAMRSGDDEEKDLLDKFIKNYTEAWKDGKLNWMRVNVTPFLEKFGQKDRYYYNVAGFFLDPTKWISRDIKKGLTGPQAITSFLTPERLTSSLAKSAYYKSSAVPQLVADYLMDTDYTFWRGFTNFGELVNKKELTKWGKNRRPVPLESIPSFMLYEGKKFLPIQVNNIIEFALGEIEGSELIAKSLGVDLKRAYAKKSRS